MYISWSDKAVVCLEEITYYISLDNIDRAYSFRDELKKAAEKLVDFPESGAPRTIGTEQVRVKVYKGYVISYQIDGDEIVIVYIHKENEPQI